MKIIESFLNFFRRLFKPKDKNRAELKKVYNALSKSKHFYYRFKNNQVMPGFAQDLYLFCKALKPLMDLADRTLAHPDIRVSRMYFDYLVDSAFSPDEMDKKLDFSYDNMKARLDNAVNYNAEMDAIVSEFQRFLAGIAILENSAINSALLEVERFTEICRHDWERLLGFFDPGISLEDKNYNPDFQSSDGELVLPELIDFFYIVSDFKFSDILLEQVSRVYDKLNPGKIEETKNRLGKIFETIKKILFYHLNYANILSLIRLCKKDPVYFPNIQRDNANYIEQYRKRLLGQFERDKTRLKQEKHESTVVQDIKDLFGNLGILTVESYDESSDSFLRRETPLGFGHVKEMSILKTFVYRIFDMEIKENVKKVLVEGFFDSKSFQNNLANILYQCERSSARITSFESLLHSGGRVSISAVQRYVEEMKHGKDILPFLSKIVDEINYRAKEICDDESGLFRMLGDTLGALLADYKKASPDLVSNIRNLGGMRNRELIGSITGSKNKIDTFVRVMRSLDTGAQTVAAGPEKATGEPGLS